MAMDNHKEGEYRPYIFKTTDGGKNWNKITNGISDRTLVWRIVQDHESPNLLFAGTEFGIYFTTNGGQKWIQFKGGLPNISFRDLAIQKRENDLVAASFGRSIYILDDYAALRKVSDQQLAEEASLFAPRKAWWYVPKSHLGFDGKRGDQGASHYVADNPPFGANFTYYLKAKYENAKAVRTEKEKTLNKNKSAIPFPGWDNLSKEKNNEAATLNLIITNSSGEVVRRIPVKNEKGFHRVNWDLRYPNPFVTRLKKEPAPDFGPPPAGFLAIPGKYTATLEKVVNGVASSLSTPQSFEVTQLAKGALQGADLATVSKFWRSYEDAIRKSSYMNLSLGKTIERSKAMNRAWINSRVADKNIAQQLHELNQSLQDLNTMLNGDPNRLEPGEKTAPTLGDRLFAIQRGVGNSTYGPTENHEKGLGIATDMISKGEQELAAVKTKMELLLKSMLKAGAPFVE